MPKTRFQISLFIIIGYFIPILLFACYCAFIMPLHSSWGVLVIGLLLTVVTTLGLIITLGQWEAAWLETVKIKSQQIQQTRPTQITEPVIDSTPLSALEEKNSEIQQLYQEQSHLQQRIQQQQQQLLHLQESLDIELQRKEELHIEYQKTVQEQRELLEKKQQQIVKLENAVHDLSYEVKTLLQISDLAHHASQQSSSSLQPLLQETDISVKEHAEHLRQRLAQSSQAAPRPAFSIPQPVADELKEFSSPLTPSAGGAIQILRRCIDVAQKLTGASHFGGEGSRFHELSVNSYALDLRRLCDALRNETGGVVMIYSQKEEKLLFANNQTKELLGWNPEKFIQDFPLLIQEGLADWKHALIQLATRNETDIRIPIKTKAGATIPMQCHLGMIPTGIFKNHLVAILQPENVIR